MRANTSSITAKVCAYARAEGALKSSGRIFDDYLAFDLLGGRERRQVLEIMRDERHRGIVSELGSIPLTRSAWAEGHLSCFAQSRQRVQYVILGAGMDTFAWRNRNPLIRVFEVDHPDTQREKRERIRTLSWSAPADVVFTGVDFTRDSLEERLLQSGFDPLIPTFVTILGVTYYLPFEAFAATLNSLSSLIKGSGRVLFDFQIKGYESMVRPRLLAEFTSTLGERMAEGYDVAALEAMLFEQGWRFSEHLDPQAIGRRFLNHQDGPKAFDSVHFMAAAR